MTNPRNFPAEIRDPKVMLLILDEKDIRQFCYHMGRDAARFHHSILNEFDLAHIHVERFILEQCRKRNYPINDDEILRGYREERDRLIAEKKKNEKRDR